MRFRGVRALSVSGLARGAPARAARQHAPPARVPTRGGGGERRPLTFHQGHQLRAEGLGLAEGQVGAGLAQEEGHLRLCIERRCSNGWSLKAHTTVMLSQCNQGLRILGWRCTWDFPGLAADWGRRAITVCMRRGQHAEERGGERGSSQGPRRPQVM
jgi:hypothetical protein